MKKVVIEVKKGKEKKSEIMPLSGEEIVKRMKERSKKHGGDTSKWIYGDRLYEEEFGRKYGGNK